MADHFNLGIDGQDILDKIDSLISEATEQDFGTYGGGFSAPQNVISMNVNLPNVPYMEPPGPPTPFNPSQLNFGSDPKEDVLDPLPQWGDVNEPTSNFGSPPAALHPFMEVAPSMQDTIQVPTIGDAPTIRIPGYPDLTAVRIPEFSAGTPPEYNREDWIVRFDDIAPNQLMFSYVDDPVYADCVRHRDWLLARAYNGGTGLPVDVENAIFQRDRDREQQLALNAERDATLQNSALGFYIPGGALQAKLDKIRADAMGKMMATSRDVAVKQAEMEIDNINKALTLVDSLSKSLMDNYTEVAKIEMESIKAANTAAVAIFDARVKAHVASVEVQKIGAQVYSAMIEAYKARVSAYQSVIEGEKAKADVNKSLIDMYIAQMRGEELSMQIYKTTVEAMEARTRIEEFKIRKFEAEINAYTAQIQAYNAELGGKKAEAEIFTERVRAYQAEVAAYGQKVEAKGKYFSAQIEARKSVISANEGRVSAYKARVDAAGTKARAETDYANALVSAQSSHASAVAAYNQVLSGIWSTEVQAHMTAQTLAMENGKINADVQRTNLEVASRWLTAQAQIRAQLGAARMNMVSVHGNLGVSASGSQNENHNHAYQERT